VSREPRHETDRIGILICTWRRHAEFGGDVGRLGIDRDTWAAMKSLMRRAARGTVRENEWEFPCATSSGSLGELKLYEADEVSYVAEGQKVIDEVTIHYRIYFNEPTLCPEELWAMGAGAKCEHPEYVGTDQQADIAVAVGRTYACSANGNELLTFDP
jgi:hypothetical protein